VIRNDTGQPNGLAFNSSGMLLMCEMQGRRVSLCPAPWTGQSETLVDSYEGARLNSPNDLVLDQSGGFYFTDPPFGLAGGDEDPNKALPFNGVFYVSSSMDSVRLVHSGLLRPNGVVLVDQGARLIVSNSHPGARIWVSIDLRGPGEAGRVTEFARLPDAEPRGAPDGMTVGPDGFIYATGADAIWRLDQNGGLEPFIRRPDDRPSNCAIGGPDGDQLFITGRRAVYQTGI
jgi:gluconolactonase